MYRHYLRHAAIVITFLLFMMHPTPAGAWKVDIHVWIANEVLEDARDGRIEIDFKGTRRSIVINPRYARAINANRQSFLLGSLGPDAFPDVVAGQLVIHPSVVGGWGTAEWLVHLRTRGDLNDQELAFALGYMTHASADIFAHTFVNRYAGDVFDLSEHRSAAIRHIYIESFVSNYLPPITDRRTGRTENAANSVRVDGGISFPETFVRERLLLNSTAVEQYRRSDSAGHFVGAYNLHRELGKLIDEGGFFDTLEANIIDLVAELNLQIPIDDQISRDLQRLERELNGWLNEQAGEASKALQKLNDEFSKIEGLQIQLAEDSFAEATRLTADVARLAIDIATLDGELADAIRERDRMLQLKQGPYEVEVSVVECLVFGPLGCLLSGIVKETRIKIPTPYQAVLDLIDEKNRLLGRAKGEMNNLERRAQQAVKSGFKLVKTAHELHRQAVNRFIAFIADKPFGNSFRNHFERWYEAIPVALTEFTRANAAAIVNSIDPAKPSVTDPLKRWLLCHGPVFVSVPNRIMDNVCFIRDGYNEMKTMIDTFEKDLAEMVPIARDVYRLKKRIEEDIAKIQQRLFDLATQEGLREFDRHAGTPTLDLYKSLTRHVDTGDVNAIMSADSSNQNLPLMGDAGERILQEMHVSDGHFDLERFNAVYNGVVLSKLALLDQSGLQALARLGGVSNSIFGSKLYSGDDPSSKNILFGFIRSIDGNHQWHDLAPPHPRATAVGFDSEDFDKRATRPDYSYSYADTGCLRKLGMRLWADPKARESIFKHIFRGKVAAGIDGPDEFTPPFSRVLPADYPNLFASGDAWGEDGITLRGKGYVPIRFTGAGLANGNIHILVNGAIFGTASYDAQGKLDFELRVPEVQFPALLEIDGPQTSNGRLRFVFDLGCDGKTVEEGVEQIPALLVQLGESLWRLALQMTGDGRRYKEIYATNTKAIRNPNLIYPGQRFTFPWESPLRVSVGPITAAN